MIPGPSALDPAVPIVDEAAPGPLIAGVDIGGTKLALGVADSSGRLLAWRYEEHDVEEGPDAVMASVFRLLNDALEEAGAKANSASGPEFIGLACPGPLSQQRGIILSTPNMPGWEDYEIVRVTRDRFPGARVLLENDANAAALGEAVFGAGKGCPFVVYFTVSTGVGGGFVRHGRVLHGKDGNAAELGHQVIIPFGGRRCGCGQCGHLEAYCNGAAVVRRAIEKMESGRETSLLEYAGTYDKIEARHISQAAGDGDALCRDVWRETAEYLAVGVSNALIHYNPDVVVIGGGLSKAGDLLLEPLRRAVAARVMNDFRGTYTIRRSALGDQVGVMGAMAPRFQHSGEVLDAPAAADG